MINNLTTILTTSSYHLHTNSILEIVVNEQHLVAGRVNLLNINYSPQIIPCEQAYFTLLFVGYCNWLL